MPNENQRPNIIVFMTDDQGYGDLSCMGATDFRTPNLDNLAANGVRFTDWYSNSPVCSPSRAALLTGRYPGNAGVRAILQGHRTASGLPNSTPTISSLLKDRGYQTSMVGKWHLGLTDECRPHSHGFDYWFGFLAGCIDFYSHIYYWGANRPGPWHQSHSRPLGKQRRGLARQRILHRTNRRKSHRTPPRHGRRESAPPVSHSSSTLPSTRRTIPCTRPRNTLLASPTYRGTDASWPQ